MATENFNRADGTTFTTIGGWGGDTSTMECRGNLAQPTAGWNEVRVWRTAGGPNAAFGEIDIVADTFAGGQVKYALLQVHATQQGYQARFTDGTTVTLYRNGSWTDTGTSPVDVTSSNATLRVARVGGNVVVSVNGTAVITWAEGAPLSGGYAGFGGAPDGTASTVRFDNFQDSISSGPGPAVAADTVTFSDSAVAITSRVAVATDTATFSDSAVSATQRVAAATDTIALSDSAVALTSRVAAATDSLTFSDSAVAISSLVAAASDSLTLSDSAVAVSSLVAAASDTVSFTDAADSVVTVVAQATDSVSFSDSAVGSASSGFTADAADTISFTDQADAITSRTAAASDTVSFDDSAVAASSLVAAASDSVTFTDSGAAVSQLVAVASDSLTLSDSAVASSVASGIIAEAADAVAFSDSADAITSRTAVASDSLVLSDEAAAQVTMVASAVDTIALSDSAVAALGSLTITVVASDTITFSDAAVAARPGGIATDPKFLGRAHNTRVRWLRKKDEPAGGTAEVAPPEPPAPDEPASPVKETLSGGMKLPALAPVEVPEIGVTLRAPQVVVPVRPEAAAPAPAAPPAEAPAVVEGSGGGAPALQAQDEVKALQAALTEQVSAATKVIAGLRADVQALGTEVGVLRERINDLVAKEVIRARKEENLRRAKAITDKLLNSGSEEP